MGGKTPRRKSREKVGGTKEAFALTAVHVCRLRYDIGSGFFRFRFFFPTLKKCWVWWKKRVEKSFRMGKNWSFPGGSEFKLAQWRFHRIVPSYSGQIMKCAKLQKSMNSAREWRNRPCSKCPVKRVIAIFRRDKASFEYSSDMVVLWTETDSEKVMYVRFI